MGNVIHHYVSIYSFVMGVMWFSTFVLLGLVMRKMKFPIMFSVVPLLLLLVLSILRMFIAVDMPGAVVIFSENLYPAIISFLRREIVAYPVFGIPVIVNVLIFIWVVVAVWLTLRFLYDYINKFHPTMTWLGSTERDEQAEAMLSEIIGSGKQFYVFRNKAVNTALATAVKPYIILPVVEFSPDKLRPILLHEWKHIQDKDYLTGFIVELICCVFWWNPLVYVLRRNFLFAQELKCDQFAVSNKGELISFLQGLDLLDKKDKSDKTDRHAKGVLGNALISNKDELTDRLEILVLREKSRSKWVLPTVCYSIAIVVLFLASYMFIILPAFWESPDVCEPADVFTENYKEGGRIFRSEEPFIVDNGDGTFSFYIDGNFVGYIDNTHEAFAWIPIREREDD